MQLASYRSKLKDREMEELEQELAHLCFDYLFIQTQIEAASPEDVDSDLIRESGERRLVRLGAKIEALKRELFNRSK